MSGKSETQLLAPHLDSHAFHKACVCAASSCVLATYFDTPSISWIANSHLVTNGEIVVDSKYKGWVQKSVTRAEWPYAVGLYRDPVVSSSCVLFVYHLAEKSYRTFQVHEDSWVALMMSYQWAVVVSKDGFFLVDLIAPENETSFIEAKTISNPLSFLCHSKSSEILIASQNQLQIWKFEVEINHFINDPNAKGKVGLVIAADVEGFGYSDISWANCAVAAVSQGGSQIHVYDTLSDLEDSDFEVILPQAVPVTKVYIDDDYLILGHLDGSITLYGADRLNLISQINVSPQALHGHASQIPGTPNGGQSLPFRISYLHRDRDLIITSMLDPTHLDDENRQLEVCIWATKSKYSVQPLKVHLLSGHIIFLHYDNTSQSILHVSQQRKEKSSKESKMEAAMEYGLTKWKLDTKSLATAVAKWNGNNESAQTKLALDIIEQVVVEQTFFEALMRINTTPESAALVSSSMLTILKDKDPDLLKKYINTIIHYEIHERQHHEGTRRHSHFSMPSSPTSSGSPRSHSPLATPQHRTSEEFSHSDSDSSKSHGSGRGTPDREKTSNFWPHGSIPTMALLSYFTSSSHSFIFSVLTDALTLLNRSEGKYDLFVPMDSTINAEKAMMKRLTKIVTSIIDGMIKYDSQLPSTLVDILGSIFKSIQQALPHASPLRILKIGPARFLISNYILAHWLDPVKYQLASKVNTASTQNVHAVARLLELVCLGDSKDVHHPYLAEFRKGITKKFRSWLLNKCRHPEKHVTSFSKKIAQIIKPPSSNAVRNSGLIVTQFIIAHNEELLNYLGVHQHGSTPDPCAARVRLISQGLLMPIVSIMAREGAKDANLAESLEVFSKLSDDSSSSASLQLYDRFATSDMVKSKSRLNNLSTDHALERSHKKQQTQGELTDSHGSAPSDRSKKRRMSDAGVHAAGSNRFRSLSSLKTKSHSKPASPHSSSMSTTGELPASHGSLRFGISQTPGGSPSLLQLALDEGSTDDSLSI